jgi:peptidoglycan/LPS O-acetylase OafA/YrhL
MLSRPHTPHHLDALTGVRAFAAVWVLVYHAWLLSGSAKISLVFVGFAVDLSPLLVMGYLGVNVFFVLSGFVLAWQVLQPAPSQQQESTGTSHTVPYAKFLRRRILRVYPAYYACVTVLLFLSLWEAHPEPTKVTDVALHLVMFHNLIDKYVSSINPVFWSMPFEWQFYLVFPFLVLALVRRRPFLLLGLGLGIAALTNLAIVVGGPNTWTHVLLAQLPFRIDEFVVGMVGAKVAGAMPRRASLRAGAFWIGVLALLGAVAYYGTVAPLWWTWNWTPFIRSFWVEVAVVAILVGLSGDVHFGSRLFASRIMVWLGTISYSIYLWHFPVLSWLASTTLVRQTGVTIDSMFTSLLTIGLALALAISAMSYYIIERPFHSAAQGSGAFSEIRVGAMRIDGIKLLTLWGGSLVVLAAVISAVTS